MICRQASGVLTDDTSRKEEMKSKTYFGSNKLVLDALKPIRLVRRDVTKVVRVTDVVLTRL